MLLRRKTTLLASVYDSFCQYASSSGTVTARHILSHLAHELKHHLQCCGTRKHETVLFQYNEDVLSCLTQALWKVRQLEQKNKNSNPTHNPEQTLDYTQTVLETVLESFNSKVLTQIKTFVDKDADTPFQHIKLNLTDIISEIYQSNSAANTVCVREGEHQKPVMNHLLLITSKQFAYSA